MSNFEPGMESMVDMFIFETTGLLEQLDQILMKTESASSFGEEEINEIFRIMHTIKGSGAMMGLQNMSTLAHAVEDMFYVLREDHPQISDIKQLYELVFQASDLLKAEIDLVQEEPYTPTDFSGNIENIHSYVAVLKGGVAAPAADAGAPASSSSSAPAKAKGRVGLTTVRVTFDEDCKMENLRALLLVNKIKDICEVLEYEPADIETNFDTAKTIAENGFYLYFKALGSKDDVVQGIEEALNVKSYEVTDPLPEAPAPAAPKPAAPARPAAPAQPATPAAPKSGAKQSMISVNLNKLDKLLDMVGEIVITEAMVTSNPDLKGLRLDNFQKAARQLRKLTDELQDVVMSIRMVPLSGAFNKMTRIVRDMKVKLNKDVDLVFEGEETEVDKGVIDSLNDPLMHMVRNSMDHGIEETAEERIANGKDPKGTITLSAHNASGEVIIVVADDGAGINPEKVLQKAKKNGLLTKPDSEYTTKEICNMIMLPGFSTNEVVTEYSGRGVGMDVVRNNIEQIGGSVTVDSKFGKGTSFIIRIPLSLAILDGMEISVGESIFTIPVGAVRESFKLQENQLIKDTEGREMVLVRGKCYPLIRLYELYGLKSQFTDLKDGILILAEADGKGVCLFADELIGEQQVVVKQFSPLFNDFHIKDQGLAGCSILGDGSITLILDISNIIFNL